MPPNNIATLQSMEQRAFAPAATFAAADVGQGVEPDVARASQNSSQRVDRARRDIEVAMPASMEYEEREADNFECVVCMDEKKTHIILPCGHYCVCAKCAASLTQCPVCRKGIQQIMRCYDT